MCIEIEIPFKITNKHTHTHALRSVGTTSIVEYRKKRCRRAVRTASDERSAQSEIYETSDNIAKRLDRPFNRPTDPTDSFFPSIGNI